MVLFLLFLIIMSAVSQEYGRYCGYNAHYESCASVYHLTCTNFSVSVDPWYEFDGCEPGCVCDSGFIFDESLGNCVLPEYCPNIGYCPPNSNFEFCRQCDGYQTTCSDYGLPYPMYCPNECKSGCYCEKDLVYDERTKDCVPVEYCSCPENEYFEPCHLKQWPSCWPGCACKPGYLFNATISRCVYDYAQETNTNNSYAEDD